jgi:hypothetical protein
MYKNGPKNGTTLANIVHSLNEEEKNDISRKIVKHLKVQKCLPSCVKHGKDIENNYKVLDSMRSEYGWLTTTRCTQYLTLKYVLLFTIVFTSGGTNQDTSQRQ